MKQIQMTSTLKFRVWREDGKDIDPANAEYLCERARAEISASMRAGNTSGDFTVDVGGCAAVYRVHWEIKDVRLTSPGAALGAILDADGLELVPGEVYRIASKPACPNRFTCVRMGGRSGYAFIRVQDAVVHLCREFIEWKDNLAYYDLMRVSAGE